MKLACALFVSSVLLAACQSAPAPTAPETQAPGSTTPDASGDAPSDSPGLTTGPATSVVGPGDFVLADPLQGLDALASYRATLTLSFDGTNAGQASAWSMTTELAAASAANAVLSTTTTGAIDPQLLAGTTEWSAMRDGTTYVRSGTGHCTISTAHPLAQPTAWLSGLIGAEPAGRETVGEIEADSYTFDQRALGIHSTAQATGRVSIATAGFVVRYDVTATGGPDYFGEGVNGTLETHYELADIGGAITADIPADCPPGAIAATLPVDATETVSEPGFLSYRVEAKLAKAVDIVRGNALIDHWKAGASRIVDDGAHLEYTSAGLALHVWITTVKGGSMVEVVGSWVEP